jgi:hypothetical protein
MADLADSLSSPQTDDVAADDNLSTPPDLGKSLVSCICLPRTNDAAKASMLSFKGLVDNTTSTSGMEKRSLSNNSTANTTERHEDWEIVNSSSLHNKDSRPPPSGMSALDIKSNDTKVLEPLDSRRILTKPFNET